MHHPPDHRSGGDVESLIGVTIVATLAAVILILAWGEDADSPMGRRHDPRLPSARLSALAHNHAAVAALPGEATQRPEDLAASLIHITDSRGHASWHNGGADSTPDPIRHLVGTKRARRPLLVFTEFRATQAMINDHLMKMGYEVVVLNGELTAEERQRAQEQFAGDARVLVSTEAGGEGLNLQMAHLVVNYDLPWNPMRVEQRIGRVDRIGQTKPVRAFNFLLEGSVEDRVHAVLETKLATILSEFGVDKLNDVLDSAGWDAAFQELYSRALTDEPLEPAVDALGEQIRETEMTLWDWRDRLGGEMPDPSEARAMRDSPFPRWLESLVIANAIAAGGNAQPDIDGWKLQPRDGPSELVTFDRSKSSQHRRYLTLGDQATSGALQGALAVSVDGQPIHLVSLPGIDASGLWTLWVVTAHAGAQTTSRAYALFQDATGILRMPTANAVWERLADFRAQPESRGLSGAVDWHAIRQAAERHGASLFAGLQTELRQRLEDDRDRLLTYIEARRKVFERIGLDNVRRRRLQELDHEKQTAMARMVDPRAISGELRCTAAVRLQP